MHIPTEIRLAEIRLWKAGVAVSEFCREASIHRATWQRWKAGTNSPSGRQWDAATTTLDRVAPVDASPAAGMQAAS